MAEVGVPVVGRELGGVESLAGGGRVERNAALTGLHLGQYVGELGADGLDMGRVGRVVDVDASGVDVPFRAVCEEVVHRDGVTGDDGGVGPVVGGDVKLSTPGAGEQLGRFGREAEGGHGAVAGEGGVDGLAAEGGDTGAVFEGQGARDNGRGDLALGVTDDGGGSDAQRFPHPGQRDHHGEQRGLDHVHAFDGLPAGEHVGQGPIDVRRQGVLTLGYRPPEDLGGAQEAGGHAGPLRTLAGEDEDGPGMVGVPGDHAGVFVALGEGVQCLQQVAPAVSQEHGAVFKAGARREQRVRDGVRVDVGVVLDVRGEPRGLGAQRLGVARRDDDRHDTRVDGRSLALGDSLLLGGLFQDDVGVGPTDAERGDRGSARTTRLGPLALLGEQPYGAGLPVDVGRGLVHVQRAGQYAVAHGLHHLDDAADAGGGLGVPDIGLERAQPQRLVGGPVLPVGGEQGLGLYRVTEAGAGAVRLDRVHLVRSQPRVGQRLHDGALLRRAVGGREAAATAVLVDGRAAQYGEHPVVVAPRLGEAFQHQDADALAPAGAVGRGGERLAAAVGGEPALPAELDEPDRRGHHRHTTDEGQGALARPQRLARQVQRDQRRRARRVHRDGGPLKPQGVRDAARDHTAQAARHQVALKVVRRLVQPGGVVLVHYTGEHPRTAAPHRCRVDARAFQRLPRHLQQDALLRVHGGRLARADPEELRIELGGAAQEATGAGVALADGVRVRVVEFGDVPATVLGEAGDGVAPAGHQLPQLLRRADVPGVAAGHADDGDRLGGRRGQRVVAPSQGLDLLEGGPQCLDDFFARCGHR